MHILREIPTADERKTRSSVRTTRRISVEDSVQLEGSFRVLRKVRPWAETSLEVGAGLSGSDGRTSHALLEVGRKLEASDRHRVKDSVTR